MKNDIKEVNMKRMAIVAALTAASVHTCATYAESVDFAKASPAGQHCIYDTVPLDGAWEMSYNSSTWDLVAYPTIFGMIYSFGLPRGAGFGIIQARLRVPEVIPAR